MRILKKTAIAIISLLSFLVHLKIYVMYKTIKILFKMNGSVTK